MKGFNHKTIVKELKEFSSRGWSFIPYVDFVFSEYTQEIFDEINRSVLKDMEMDSRMIIGVLLFGVEDKVSSFSRLEYLTKAYTTYYMFTRDLVIEQDVFESFLKNCDRKLLKKLFLTTVVEFRDIEFLDLSKMVTYSDYIIPLSKISVQQTIANDSIILQGLAVTDNDDETALENILVDLKETQEILAELQDSIGKTGSLKTVNNAFKNTQMFLHSRYCSNENLETAYLHDFDILVKPKELTRQIPKKYKENPLEYKDEIFNKYNKLTKRHLFRKHNGYTCIYNGNSKLINSYVNNGKYNKTNADSSEYFKELTYEYEMVCKPDCPFEEICSVKTFKQMFTPLKNNMLNKFMHKQTEKSYSIIKNGNYQISVQFKKIKELIHDLNYDEELVQNYLLIINTALNIKRKIKLKGTLY